MKKYLGSLAALCLLFAGVGLTAPSTATAQDQAAGAMPPPNVLVIIREFLKPGKSGSMHEKSESAFVRAMTQANSPTHYIAANSLSGRSRALFFIGYDSFADWGKDNEALMGNSSLSQAYDSAQQADGELLTSIDTNVFVFQPDMSVSPNINVGRVHYWEITMLKVRPGHDEDWEALAKLHNDVFGKMPNAHWTVWEKYFGAESGGLYIVTTGLRSLAELDQHRAAGHRAWSQASADQKKKMSDLEASTFESIETNLYAVDPKMSYIADSWRTADPGFWGQK
ncbi:MAG: hypothetical protein WA708_09155 [Acidobacteriaceae bacterium]